MLLIHSSLGISDCPEMNNHQFVESVWGIICPNKHERILVGVCYWSPSKITKGDFPSFYRKLHPCKLTPYVLKDTSILDKLIGRQEQWMAQMILIQPVSTTLSMTCFFTNISCRRQGLEKATHHPPLISYSQRKNMR